VLSVSLTIEYRAVIKLFVKEGLTSNEINSKFIKVYGDSSPSFSTIKKWAAQFKRGRTGLEDDPREGRPKSATTPEIVEQVQKYGNHNLDHNSTILIVLNVLQFYKTFRCLRTS
jgi:transposase